MNTVGGSLGSLALGIMKSKEAKTILGRFFRKVWKMLRLKSVKCIVVNDIHRLKLVFDYPVDKYQYLDVEKVYLSLLSDGEIARLSELKKVNPRAWIISVREPCKRVLNTVREQWRNERVILCVSNTELAKELHVDNVNVFVQDKELHEEMVESVDGVTGEYLSRMLKQNSKGEYTEYKSYDQLIHKLEKLFK